MKRYIMFVDWKNQFCRSDCTTQGNRQIQRNSYQITSGIFHRTKTNKNLEICVKTKKNSDSKRNLEKENLSWRNQAP